MKENREADERVYKEKALQLNYKKHIVFNPSPSNRDYCT
jgi:hypothetical protein